MFSTFNASRQSAITILTVWSAAPRITTRFKITQITVTIIGGAGNDSIYNFWYAGTLNGGAGNDTLYANSDGRNTLTGGAGSDLFRFYYDSDSRYGTDFITDYAEEDTIRIDNVAINTVYASGSDVVFGMAGNADDIAGSLPYGAQRRLEIVRALATNPKLLLLDEHTAALDPTNAEIVMNLTRRFAEDYKLTVMMVTHNMQHALDFGNRLLMMNKGEIISDIQGEEKSRLTMDSIVELFKKIKVNNDNVLLS